MRQVWIALVLVGCTGESVKDAAPVEPMAPGGELVEVDLDRGEIPVWHLAATPLLRIGRAEGAEPYLFQRIQAAARLEGGGFVIAEVPSREYRVFDEQGRFVRKYGGSGEGPGEFRGWQVLSGVSKDRIAAYDPVLARVTVYDLNAGLVSTQRIPSPPCDSARANPGSWSCLARAIWPDGRLLSSRSRGSVEPIPDERLFFRRAAMQHFSVFWDSSFQDIDSIPGADYVNYRGRQVGMSVPYWGSEALYAPRGQFALGDGIVVFGRSDRFELLVRSEEGPVERVIRIAKTPETVTRAMVDSLRRAAARKESPTPGPQEYLDRFESGGPVPFFSNLAVDRTGRIWIQDYLPPPTLAPPGPKRWTILTLDGNVLARLEESRSFDILEWGGDYALALTTDELGVERVELYAILRMSE